MAAALAKVKRELGRHAVILNTRTIKEPGWLGLRPKSLVEITATDEPDVLRAATRRAKLGSRSGRSKAVSEQVAEGTAMSRATSAQPVDSSSPSLHDEVRRVRTLVEDVLAETRRPRDAAALPEHLRATYVQLLQQEVSEQLAIHLIEGLRNELTLQQLSDPDLVRGRLETLIARMVPIAGPVALSPADGPRVVALIGPTGVGKTTTIAKLAANFKLREGKKVALITIDSYRIAAVDQLKTYAEIIDIPLSVVLTPDDLASAVHRYQDVDLILIDTAGRSQNDTIRLNELKRFLDAAGPHEVHLVLSSTSTRSAMLRMAEAFVPIGVNRIILTKLDEAVGFGVVLSLLQQVSHKLSYLTTGQDVPDDIEICEGGRLAGLVLGASTARTQGSLPGTGTQMRSGAEA